MVPLPVRPQTATHKLVGNGWERLTEWSNSLIDETADALFVPWLYLYLDFVLRTNCGGVQPTRAYKIWSWLSRPEANQHAVVERVKWFRLLLLRVYKLENKMLTSQYARPSSLVVRICAHCVCLRFNPARFKAVETYLQSFKAAFLLGKDIESVAT